MTDARSQILGLVRRARGERADAAAVDARLAARRPNLIPARAQLPHAEQVALFLKMAAEAACTVERVAADADVPEALATYVANKAFPEGLEGLTGTEAEIRAAADAFKADYSRVDQPGSMAEYTMDHTSLLYLMDEEWKLKTFFTHQDTPDTIAACLEEVMG